MGELAQIQQAFLDQLVGKNDALSNLIESQGTLTPAQRVEIYENAYRIRLRETIDQDHEQLGKYLGDDLFEQMVEEYIAQYPSNFSSLRYFADKLPEFLARNEPFSNYPILAEIAFFERQLLVAFDSPEQQAIDATRLEAIAPEQWPTLCFKLHPSLRWFAMSTSAVESWQALKQDNLPPSEPLTSTRLWAIWRSQQLRTEYCSLSELEFELIANIAEQKPFAELCEVTQHHIPVSEISATLIQFLNTWLERGWITDLG